MGAAQQINGDANLPACPSFCADFNVYMPAYFKPVDCVYLKSWDLLRPYYFLLFLRTLPHITMMT
jgi:hypothetical protein